MFAISLYSILETYFSGIIDGNKCFTCNFESLFKKIEAFKTFALMLKRRWVPAF